MNHLKLMAKPGLSYPAIVYASGYHEIAYLVDSDFKDKSTLMAYGKLFAASPELLEELKYAHVIIKNALNSMTVEQKEKWNELNERDGVKDGMALTRADARQAAIEKATK